MPTVGDVLFETQILRDNAGLPFTGLVDTDFAVLEAYALSQPTTTAVVSVVEIGEGEYSFSFSPSSAATWTLHIVFADPSLPIPREYSATWIVDPIGAGGAGAPTTDVLSTIGPLTSLFDLRRAVAEEFGDFHELIATATGADNTVIDDERLVLANNAYAGSQAYVKAGTAANIGVARFVTGSSTTSHSLTVNPHFPAPTQSGDVFWLFCLRGKGYVLSELDRAINRAIRFARSFTTIVLSVEMITPFDKDVGTLTIPNYFTGISSVEAMDETGMWSEVRRASAPSGNGWMLLPGRQMRITGTEGALIDGFGLRLHGEGLPLELTAGSEMTSIPSEWIVYQACAYLSRQGMDRLPQRADRERLMQYYENLAEQLLYTIHNVGLVNATKVV